MRLVRAVGWSSFAALLVAAPAGGKPAQKRGAAVELVLRGDVWTMAGHCDQAIPLYRKAVAADGKDAKAKVRLAHCLIQQGQPPQVEEGQKLLVGLADAPGLAGQMALQEVGDLALAAGDFAAAAQAFEKLAARAPRDGDAQICLLDALAGLAKKGDAAAKARGIELAVRLKVGPWPEAQHHAAELEAVLKFGDAGEDLLIARSKIAMGDVRGAIAVLERVVGKNPGLEEAQALLGTAYASPDVGRRDDARKAWKRAPHVKEALLALGVDAYEGGDLDDAERRLKDAIALDGKYQEAFYQLGLVAKERGDIPAAKSAWSTAKSIDPSSELGRWAATKLQVITGQIDSLAEGQVLDSASEVAIGQRLAEELSRQFGRRDDAALQARLDGILKRLTTVSDRPPGELRYRVMLVDAPMVNALTLPGGTILVFAGIADLIKKMGDSDDAWAAVLGHECAHAALRHGMGMVQVASSLSGARAFGADGSGLADLMNTVSRAHEFEADQFGALYAYRAGFNPAVEIALFEEMRRDMGEIPHGLNHPTDGERVARVRDYLLDLRAKVRGFDLATKALKEGDFDGAREHLEVFLGVFPESLSARSNLVVAIHRKALAALGPSSRFRRATDVDPNSRARPIALHAGEVSVGLKAAPKIDERLLREAAGEYQAALAVDPSYAPALTNLGAALDDLRDHRRARDVLEQAVRVAPQSKEAWNNLAAVAAGMGDTARALAALDKATALEGGYADAWFNRALVLEQAGRAKDAAAAWDRYLSLDSKSGWAEVARNRRAQIK